MGVTPDYALNEISYANLVLYNSAMPSYEKDEKEKEKVSGDSKEGQAQLEKLLNEQF